MENKKRSIIGIVLMSALLGLGMIYIIISRVIFDARGMIAEATGFLIAGISFIGIYIGLGISACLEGEGKESLITGDHDGHGA